MWEVFRRSLVNSFILAWSGNDIATATDVLQTAMSDLPWTTANKEFYFSLPRTVFNLSIRIAVNTNTADGATLKTRNNLIAVNGLIEIDQRSGTLVDDIGIDEFGVGNEPLQAIYAQFDGNITVRTLSWCCR